MTDSHWLIISGERPAAEQAHALIRHAMPLIAEVLNSYENKNGSDPARGHPGKDRRPEEDEC